MVVQLHLGVPRRETLNNKTNKKEGIMGDRGQVQIISAEGSPDLFFYTHWGASNLENVVASAIMRGGARLGDEEYFNRIIFSEMIKDEVLKETGYGIGFDIHGDVYKLVVVNYKDKTVGIKGVSYPVIEQGKNEWDAKYDYSNPEWLWTQEPIPFSNFAMIQLV